MADLIEWEFPVVMTQQEAEAKRGDIARCLRRMADDIEFYKFIFLAGERFSIVRDFSGVVRNDKSSIN